MENFFKVIKTEEPKQKKYLENEDIGLLYNKYEPRDFNSLVINKEIGLKLKNIIDSKDILNLYIYGPYGSGKYLLSKLYVNGCMGLDYKLNPSTYTYDGKELNYLNIHVQKAISIEDSIESINYELKEISNKKVDYVFITGGLGGTVDDVTVEAISRFLKSSTYFDEAYYLKLQKSFQFH